jgi:tetratricopeptide (TPR) repeat protein
MNRRSLILTLALVGMTGGATFAFDTIQTTKSSVSGTVIGMDATKVEFRRLNNALVKQIPANQIKVISFDSDPPEMVVAKKHVLAGRYAEALAMIERIKTEPTRAESLQDLAFYKGLCTAKLALGGTMQIAEAGRLMKAFADANPKSFHYFEATETVGDLLMAVGQYAMAADYYAKLEAAPWPECRMRAGVAVGHVLLAQGKNAEALAAFDKVIAVKEEGDAAQTQRTAATLGKAAALVALKRPAEAAKLAEDFLRQKVDVENVPLMAKAYNVLGDADLQAGHTKEALMAFLHVDVLYSAASDAHAEALAHLIDLWEQVHQIERSNLARKALESQYPESPWAKKLRKE